MPFLEWLNQVTSKVKCQRNWIRFTERFGWKRIKWIVEYTEIIQGGERSRSQKLPTDGDGKPIPWYTYPAIEFIKDLDLSSWQVFEFGSGNSSFFWVSRCAKLHSVEHDTEWYEKISQVVHTNHTLVLRTNHKNYVTALSETQSQFDLIVIDGILRYDCAVEAMKHITPKGIIILDNSDWYPTTCAFLRNSGLTQIDFKGIGPINSYAWCTTLFLGKQAELPRQAIDHAPHVLGGLDQVSKYDQPFDNKGEKNGFFQVTS